MVLVAVWLTAVLAALLGLWATWFTIRDRPVILKQLIFGGVVVVSMLAQVVVAVAGLVGGHTVTDPWTFWGYVATSIVLLPVAGIWAFADRTRWSSVVLLVACLAICAMQLRVWQVWSA